MPLAKRARRGYRRVTSPARSLPDFLVVGGLRCGTSSFFHWIGSHPDVDRPAMKEIHFFDLNYERGAGWYRSYFPRKAPGHLTFEATPSYLTTTIAASRAGSLVPGAGVIVLLREPAERAWSHYRFQHARGIDTRPFDIAIKEELNDPTAPFSAYYDPPSSIPYLIAGRYAEPVRRWLDAFGRDRVLILDSGAMFTDPAATLRRVESFVGLRRVDLPFQHRNAAPPREPDPEVMAYVRAYYAEPNRRLRELVDQPIGWLDAGD